jgi:hypothetical protein
MGTTPPTLAPAFASGPFCFGYFAAVPRGTTSSFQALASSR